MVIINSPPPYEKYNERLSKYSYIKTGVRVLTEPNKFSLRHRVVSYRTLLETNCSEGIYTVDQK